MTAHGRRGEEKRSKKGRRKRSKKRSKKKVEEKGRKLYSTAWRYKMTAQGGGGRGKCQKGQKS
jgi:hypothetical protein